VIPYDVSLVALTKLFGHVQCFYTFQGRSRTDGLQVPTKR